MMTKFTELRLKLTNIIKNIMAAYMAFSVLDSGLYEKLFYGKELQSMNYQLFLRKKITIKKNIDEGKKKKKKKKKYIYIYIYNNYYYL